MNILIINQYVGKPIDGMGNRHYMFAKELISRGHSATIVASSFSHRTRTEDHLSRGERWKKEIIDGVPFVWVRTPPYTGNGLDRIWNMLCFASRIMAWSKEFQLEHPDVVVGSSPHLFAAFASQRLARRYDVPFVLEIRDLWPETLIELGNYSRRNPGILMMEQIERRIYRSADHIISLLPGGIDHISQKGGRREKITWVPNGIDLKSIPPPRPSYGNNSKFTVMYAGAHGLANGLDSILDAAALIWDMGFAERVQFRFIGDGPEKNRLQERARNEGLTTIQFEPYVPRKEIYNLLQEADAFVITLKDAALFKRFGVSPNKLFDYLASGRAVIFGIDALNNPVKESKAGFTVPPGDAEALAHAIIQLMEMSLEERWEMGLRGRRYVEEFHDYGRLADKIETILFEVTKTSH